MILNFKKEIKMNFNENKYKYIIGELIHDFVKAWEESNSSYKTPHQIAEFLKEIKTKKFFKSAIKDWNLLIEERLEDMGF